MPVTLTQSRWRPHWICCALLVSTVLWITHSARASSPENVPDFTLEAIQGDSVTLSDLRGKVVLINFWATWCPPCVEELPSMDALKASFSDKPFEILAVNMSEDRNQIEAFLKRSGLNLDFPLLLDPSGGTAKDYAVSGLPATLLVRPNGKFAYGGVGARDWNSKEVRDEILPLFEDQAETN